MSTQPRIRSRVLAAALSSLFALAVLSPRPAGAGEVRSKRTGSTTSWSSGGSSSKAVRTEVRDHHGTGYSYTSSDDDTQDGPAEVDAFVLWNDDDHSRNGSGSTKDWREAEDARKDAGGRPAFWFRRGGDRYLISDPALLRELDEMFAPQLELGRRQGLLGRKQGELGHFQGELGRKQGELGLLQAQLSRRQSLLSTQVSTLSLRGRETSPLERELEEVSRQQDEVGEMQAELGAQQSSLGEKQSALGEKQSALGEEQSALARKINAQMGPFTREAIAAGKAERLER